MSISPINVTFNKLCWLQGMDWYPNMVVGCLTAKCGIGEWRSDTTDDAINKRTLYAGRRESWSWRCKHQRWTSQTLAI
jgi:hypothetical protein